MRALFFLLVTMFLCSACVYSPRPSDEDGLRDIIPTAEKDRGPRVAPDLSHVQDAVPRHERRTRAGNKSPYKVKGVVYRVMDDPTGYKEKGVASWYGKKFHGQLTSNGEVYDMYEMTAAHKTLPIPSYVRVTNTQNNKSVVVRVNDRGPFAKGRIIDLSYAAADRLDYTQAGTAPVEVEYIETAHLAEASLVEQQQQSFFAWMQAGAFASHDAAQNLRSRIMGQIDETVVIAESEDKGLYKVLVGPARSEIQMNQIKSRLSELGVSGAYRVDLGP
jgi:rare lipoprotein A